MEAKGNTKMNFLMKFSYAVGQLTDSIGFNLFYVFFLFFLTDYVKIAPAKAGTITLIAVLWDGLTDPVIGYISDNLKSKYGRRRPLMLLGALPYGVFTFLLFHNIQGSETFLYVYYLVLAIVYWSVYKIFVIPYFSLGAELTDDFDERTSLRAWASVFLYIGVLISSSLPPVIVDFVIQAGGTATQGWDVVGILMGALVLITALFSWNFTRGGENLELQESREEEEQTGFFRNIKELFSMKASIYLGISVFSWACAAALLSGGIIYLIDNNLAYSASQQSYYFIFLALISIVFVPFINSLSQRFDKKSVFAVSLVIATIALLLFAVVPLTNYLMVIIYTALYSWGNAVFWTNYYSMMYDISELDEFIYGQRREGTITSLMSFAQKAGAALATWLIGFSLSLANYDGTIATQTPAAERMILYLVTLIPGILGSIAAGAAFIYPITKPRFEALMTALVAKRKGEEYSTKDFEKML